MNLSILDSHKTFFFVKCEVFELHMSQDPQHTPALIHRGFINSVLQKEDQANLPPMVRPRCSLKVASERPINQCSFNLSNRKKKKKKILRFSLHRRTQSSENSGFFFPKYFFSCMLVVDTPVFIPEQDAVFF